MAIECAVITAILAVMVGLFFRRKNKQWAWATIPLALVPLTEVFIEVVLSKLLNIDISIFGCMLAIMIAAAIACAWAGFVSSGFKSKKNSAAYTVIANAFNICLAAILIYNVLSHAGKLAQTITF